MHISATSAVTLLSRTASLNAERRDAKDHAIDVAALNGVAPDDNTKPKSKFELKKISDDMFNVNRQPNVTEMKLKIYDRIGQEFGLKRDDFKSIKAFAVAIKAEMAKFAPADLQKIFREIEKETGLDKMGITVEQAINSMLDPLGPDDEKLSKAIEGELDKVKNAEDRPRIQKDDIGLYRATRV